MSDEPNIISLCKAREERNPHLSGPARCLSCKHEWILVAPVGTANDYYECPQCHRETGIMTGACGPPGDVSIWACGCGNDLFYLTEHLQAVCPSCGSFVDMTSL
jgi:DNA-directed RNA polymerase subunit RPC12/RpoP